MLRLVIHSVTSDIAWSFGISFDKHIIYPYFGYILSGIVGKIFICVCVCVMLHINISYSLSIVDLVSMAVAVVAVVVGVFFWLTTQTIRFERSLFQFWQNLYVFLSYRTYNMLIKLIRTGIYPIFYSTKLILNESFIIVNLIWLIRGNFITVYFFFKFRNASFACMTFGKASQIYYFDVSALIFHFIVITIFHYFYCAFSTCFHCFMIFPRVFSFKGIPFLCFAISLCRRSI